jgi:epoxyqueuosine reductase
LFAVALGNSEPSELTVEELKKKKTECSELVEEHIDWAIKQQQIKEIQPSAIEPHKKTKRLIRTIEKMLPRDA